jgi:hypothetical protein
VALDQYTRTQRGCHPPSCAYRHLIEPLLERKAAHHAVPATQYVCHGIPRLDGVRVFGVAIMVVTMLIRVQRTTKMQQQLARGQVEGGKLGPYSPSECSAVQCSAVKTWTQLHLAT